MKNIYSFDYLLDGDNQNNQIWRKTFTIEDMENWAKDEESEITNFDEALRKVKVPF
jgi:hypothetical protein